MKTTNFTIRIPVPAITLGKVLLLPIMLFWWIARPVLRFIGYCLNPYGLSKMEIARRIIFPTILFLLLASYFLGNIR
ncbi:hypothetical protein [Serratia nevei]|uniref:hypothetical protein n=1 Tax=Serratia nevei TaxID=2703794 RepID=UPI00254FA186|nr:hypothetical protein [Serratia nevei]MDK5165533.1 hypothetical protein [Serratia nevei]